MADTQAQPLAFASVLTGSVLLIAGVTGSSLRSVLAGHPDHANAGGPAGASSAGAAPAGSSVPVNTHGLANPVPGFTKGRTDQGVDYSGRPGQGIYAIAPGRVLGILSNWYKGQPLLYYEVTSGELKGRVIYVAEQIVPSVRPGQQIRAGQQIGTYASSGTGIETGYATSSGATLAQATTGYTEGQETAAGRAFRQLLERL